MNLNEISCFECKFYNSEEYICDLNYRSMAILDESQSAKECKYYTEGKFIDSDEHLLVDVDWLQVIMNSESNREYI